ncbi:MAG: LpxI family protein [Verrucomicrobia bacterium]|nr:LpxI family protein [Verrucomicrobiota bacterium]
MSNRQLTSLGLIAGSRSLPLCLAREARAAGIQRLVAVAFEGETDPALVPLVDEIVWMRVGQLDRMIQAFVTRGIHQCVMVGQIAPSNLFQLRPDLRAMKLLLQIQKRNAHSLFSAIGAELARDGVELIEATPWLRTLMPASGYRVGRELSAQELADVAYGREVALQVAGLDIGQTVVVKEGAVLAVEGLEGTDACLARGGDLAGKSGGAVAVKIAKASHDMRFDIPCVGPRTVEACAEHGIRVLAFEAGRSLLLDREETERLAVSLKVTLVVP